MFISLWMNLEITQIKKRFNSVSIFLTILYYNSTKWQGQWKLSNIWRANLLDNCLKLCQFFSDFKSSLYNKNHSILDVQLRTLHTAEFLTYQSKIFTYISCYLLKSINLQGLSWEIKVVSAKFTFKRSIGNFLGADLKN